MAEAEAAMAAAVKREEAGEEPSLFGAEAVQEETIELSHGASKLNVKESGLVLEVDRQYAAFKVEPKRDEREDGNFPPHLHAVRGPSHRLDANTRLSLRTEVLLGGLKRALRVGGDGAGVSTVLHDQELQPGTCLLSASPPLRRTRNTHPNPNLVYSRFDPAWLRLPPQALRLKHHTDVFMALLREGPTGTSSHVRFATTAFPYR